MAPFFFGASQVFRDPDANALTPGVVTADLVNYLCSPLGGLSSNSSATNSTPAMPSPSAFTGDGFTAMERSLGWIVIGLVGVLGLQVLL